MSRNLMIAAALSGLSLMAAAPAFAQDVTMWRPQTAAGGAPVDPSFWNNQAMVRLNGLGGVTNNVTVAPTSSSYYDYSTRTHQDTNTTHYTGGQTNNVTTTVNGDQVTNQNGDQTSTTNVTGGQTSVSTQGNFTGPGGNLTVGVGSPPPSS